MPIRERLAREVDRLKVAWASLDRQTAFVLVAAGLLMILQTSLGSRRFFRMELAEFFPESARGLLAWGWWFGFQAISGFLIPVLALIVLFRRSPREIGLGLGDWRFSLWVAAAYLPMVVIGTWFLSAGSEFQAQYPHYHPAAFDWGTFAVYELLFLSYWIGWEYLWRGFVLFGTAPRLGIYAIFVQALPFALLHLSKPLAEAVLSLVGGIALGALVWRSRSFWIAVPIHAAQMMILDFWCTMRLRTGENGLGLDALIRLFGF